MGSGFVFVTTALTRELPIWLRLISSSGRRSSAPIAAEAAGAARAVTAAIAEANFMLAEGRDE